MKIIRFILLAGIITLFACNTTPKEEPIKIALQAWSFNRFSFETAVQKAAELGFKYIEMFPGQKIQDSLEANTHFNISAENQQLIKSILEENEITLVQYGVVTCHSKEEWIQLFDFAKAMGIKTINSEPDFEDYNLLDSLTQSYEINLAVHNHATGTMYWDPQIVLDQISDKGNRLGACADNGHWMRSGLNPVESLKKYEGRLLAMHIKDMSEFNNLDAHTVPFGTGVLDIEPLINELKRQNFKGFLTLEYEYNWETPDEDIKLSLENLKKSL